MTNSNRLRPISPIRFSQFRSANESLNFEQHSQSVNGHVFTTVAFLLAFFHAAGIDTATVRPFFERGTLDLLPSLKTYLNEQGYTDEQLISYKENDQLPDTLINHIVNFYANERNDLTYRNLLSFATKNNGMQAVIKRLTLRQDFLQQVRQKMLSEIHEANEETGRSVTPPTGILPAGFAEIYAMFYGYRYGSKNSDSLTGRWVYNKVSKPVADIIRSLNPYRRNRRGEETRQRRRLNYEHLTGQMLSEVRELFAKWQRNMQIAQDYATENGLNRDQKFRYFRKLMNNKIIRNGETEIVNQFQVPCVEDQKVQDLRAAAARERFNDRFIAPAPVRRVLTAIIHRKAA